MKIQRKSMRSGNRVMADTDVAPEASELLFETEDVAQIVSEITGEDVDVTVDGEVAEFAVGDETYTCEAENIDEVMESSAISARKRKISASAKRNAPLSRGKRVISASKTVRRLPRK